MKGRLEAFAGYAARLEAASARDSGTEDREVFHTKIDDYACSEHSDTKGLLTSGGTPATFAEVLQVPAALSFPSKAKALVKAVAASLCCVCVSPRTCLHTGAHAFLHTVACLFIYTYMHVH